MEVSLLKTRLWCRITSDYYRPCSEASEGYVFTGVCHSVTEQGGRWHQMHHGIGHMVTGRRWSAQGEMVCPGGEWTSPSPPPGQDHHLCPPGQGQRSQHPPLDRATTSPSPTGQGQRSQHPPPPGQGHFLPPPPPPNICGRWMEFMEFCLPDDSGKELGRVDVRHGKRQGDGQLADQRQRRDQPRLIWKNTGESVIKGRRRHTFIWITISRYLLTERNKCNNARIYTRWWTDVPAAVTSIATQLIPPITMEPQNECRLPNLQQKQHTFCFKFLEDISLFGGHWYPYFGVLATFPLDFKARVGSALFALGRGICITQYLRFTSDATPANLLVASMAAEPISSTYLQRHWWDSNGRPLTP